MSLQEQVAQAFAPGSALSRAVEQFRPRPGQTEMAVAVARAIDGAGMLVVEAGTGVGKTFSYLVPVLLSGVRVLLSTATKTLQDQLFGRDLPQLVKALELPVRSALLKGRGSYLCLHRMELARQDEASHEPMLARALTKIERWSHITRTGDLAELSGIDERSPILPYVTSSRENCLGSECPKFRACHVNQARREALGADVLVINHHLFFADLVVRDSGMAELLPTVQAVVFDEAHQLNETGLQFLGNQLSTGQVIEFGRDLLAVGLQQARGMCDWQKFAVDTEHAARHLRGLLGTPQAGLRLRWNTSAPDRLRQSDWQPALMAVREACEGAVLAVRGTGEIGPDFGRLAERGAALVTLVDLFMQERSPGNVRWLDVGAQLRLVESPLDIAQAVRAKMVSPTGGSESRRSWIFTSATLGDDPRLRWFTEPCGLENAEIMRVESPFDYRHQAALYVPPDLPRPGDPGHSAAVAGLVARMAPLINGRTMVLTTTLRALRGISGALIQHFGGSRTMQILVQGQGPKRELMDRFRNAVHDEGTGCILVGSASFWEGVDVPGNALQMVVIDKLPFPPPNDPLVQARCERLEAAGRSAFNDYFVPEAAVSLKQGAGRLIRRESDRGVLVLCDTRLMSMGYGRRLIAALPPMRLIKTEPELVQALEGLTRTSTMVRSRS